MSWPLLREAEKDTTLGARQLRARLVLQYLARRADDAGVVKIGTRAIAEAVSMDRSDVRRLLARLEDMGRIDCLEQGAQGRGRTTTWRVLSMAEWRSRMEAEKGVSVPPISAPRKGGLRPPEKGVSTPPREHTQNSPLPPTAHPAAAGAASSAPTATPSLPGLGPGEEHLQALGGVRASRAAGRDEQAHAATDEEIAEGLRARAELMARYGPRRAAG